MTIVSWKRSRGFSFKKDPFKKVLLLLNIGARHLRILGSVILGRAVYRVRPVFWSWAASPRRSLRNITLQGEMGP